MQGGSDVTGWLQAGTALAGVVATGVGFVIRRLRRFERRLERRLDRLERRMRSTERLASDAYSEAGEAHRMLRTRLGSLWSQGRRWSDPGPRGPDEP